MANGAGIVLITGGSRGIGAAVARTAAAQGWSVMLTYRERREAADEVVESIVRSGGAAAAVGGNVTVPDDVARFFDATQERFGPVTGLVNNAGIDGGPQPLLDTPLAELRAVLDVNVLGTLLCCQEAVRRMATDRGGPGGVIVNLGSVAARLGAPGERVHYAASKGAISSLTTGLGREVIRQGIRVNCVSPGMTETEMNPPDKLQRVAPTIPIARPATPGEIAAAVLFLLSPQSSYMVGAEITVSGGR